MQILVEFITNSPESKQTKVKLAVKFPPAPSCVLSASNKKLSCLEIHSLLHSFKTPQPSAKINVKNQQ